MNAVQNEWGSWHLAVSGTCRYFTPTRRPSLGHTAVSRWRSTDSKSTNSCLVGTSDTKIKLL